MIQSSAEQTLSLASAGNPNGPIPNETSVTAVAAKKKIEAIAIRRRSSCAASLAQMAHARERELVDRVSPSPRLPVSPSIADGGSGRLGGGGWVEGISCSGRRPGRVG